MHLLNLQTAFYCRAREYNEIRDYFTGERSYAEVSERGQGLIESLQYDADEFALRFPYQNDQGRWHELRTQLKSELSYDTVVSQSEFASFEQGILGQEFRTAFPNGYNGEHYMDLITMLADQSALDINEVPEEVFSLLAKAHQSEGKVDVASFLKHTV